MSSLPVVDRWDGRRAGAHAWEPPARPTTVIVPHPDDEVVMFGGLIAWQCRRQLPVTVVAVTDGEASHPGVAGLARRRRAEQGRALERLAAHHVITLRRLDLPDGGVQCHGAALRNAIAEACPPDALLAAPWHLDHHCDHQAVGAAARTVAGRLGLSLVAGIFWGWQHADPASVDAAAMVALRLDAEVRRRRDRALACHRSQVTAWAGPPVLGRRDLEPLGWKSEFYVMGGPS